MSLPPEDGAFLNQAKKWGETLTDMEDFLQAYKESPGGRAQELITIAAGVIAPTSWSVLAAAQTGTADDITSVDTASMENGRMLVVRPDAGDTITLIHDGVNVILHRAEDAAMSGDQGIVLLVTGTDQVSEIFRFGREPSIVAGTDVSYNGNWTIGGGYAMRWWKDNDGVVHVSGYAANTVDPDSDSLIITFGPNHRPPAGSLLFFPVPDQGAGGSAVQAVNVAANGQCHFTRYVGTADGSANLAMNFSFPTTL